MPKTKYIWDEDNILYETDGNDAVTAQYTYSPEQYGNLISEHRNGTTYTHYYDAQGSTLAMTDETGHVTDRFTYNAWGEEIARTRTTETSWRWIGRLGYYFDSEMAGHSVRERQYHPTTNRWTSIDKLWFPLPEPPYIYCWNAPLRLSDPSGLAPPDPIRAACTAGCLAPHGATAQIGALDATRIIYTNLQTRTVSARSFESADGIAIGIHFTRNAGYDFCCCDTYRYIQVVQSNMNYGTTTYPRVDGTPFYDGPPPDGGVFSTDGKLPPPTSALFQGTLDNPRTGRIKMSIFDFPRRADAVLNQFAGGLNQVDMNYEACLICIRNGNPDQILRCVSFGFSRRRSGGSWRGASGTGPSCLNSPSRVFIDTLDRQYPNYSYQLPDETAMCC